MNQCPECGGDLRHERGHPETRECLGEPPLTPAEPDVVICDECETCEVDDERPARGGRSFVWC